MGRCCHAHVPSFLKKIIYTVITICIFSAATFAQNIVSGIIIDSESNEPLVGANIIVKENNITKSYNMILLYIY